eukprot:TRINITY_DN4227_c0_g1_i9.p1 TRINITY_DN4227_c0_g1~~TRINITY_DN4227_c0_g1_i9.p1  ORF type:complete len:487 (-),score=103.57 TRINITY_DN4227_c0_g1_i9:310-1770(-)
MSLVDVLPPLGPPEAKNLILNGLDVIPFEFCRGFETKPTTSPTKYREPEGVTNALLTKNMASKVVGSDPEKALKMYFSAGMTLIEHGRLQDLALCFSEVCSLATTLLNVFMDGLTKDQILHDNIVNNPPCFWFDVNVVREKELLAVLMLKYKAQIYLARTLFLYNRNLGINYFFSALKCIIHEDDLMRVGKGDFLEPQHLSQFVSSIISDLLPVATFMDESSGHPKRFFIHMQRLLKEISGCLTCRLLLENRSDAHFYCVPASLNSADDPETRIPVHSKTGNFHLQPFLVSGNNSLGRNFCTSPTVSPAKKQQQQASNLKSDRRNICFSVFLFEMTRQILEILQEKANYDIYVEMSKCYFYIDEKWWGVDILLHALEMRKTDNMAMTTHEEDMVEDFLCVCFINSLLLDDGKRVRKILKLVSELRLSSTFKVQLLIEVAEANLRMDYESVKKILSKNLLFMENNYGFKILFHTILSRMEFFYFSDS